MKMGKFRLMNAAGWVKTLDGVRELARSAVTDITVGSFTPMPREGNAGNTFWQDVNGGSLNSLGLPNGGIPYLKKHLPEMVRVAHGGEKRLRVSIAGFNPNDYGGLAHVVAEGYADEIEINLGCPNVWVGTEQKPIASFAPDIIDAILRSVRNACGGEMALAVKVSPYSNPLELERVAKLIAESPVGVAAIATTNTFPNALAWNGGEQAISVGTGLAGLGGSPMKYIGLGQVMQFCIALRATSIKVIGVGGIRSGQDVLDYRVAGADGVQVGTAYFTSTPRIFSDILQEYIELVGGMAS